MKKKFCLKNCQVCTACICYKNGEFCSSKCLCKDTCQNQPKAIEGYPPLNWPYTSISFFSIIPDKDYVPISMNSNTQLTSLNALQLFWPNEKLQHLIYLCLLILMKYGNIYYYY